jgi:GntR family transcriptional regulator/MocR family aminotransferase
MIPADSIFLDADDDGTLQHKIQRLIAEGILSGRFRPGERMPSSRKLADHLGVSRITVTIAYTNLVSDDYLVARGRSGYFVSETAPTSPSFTLANPSEESEMDWARILSHSYTLADKLTRPEDWQRYPYPFIYGQTDPALLDHQNWRLCALQALGQKDFEALTSDYYERDDPQLIEYILRHILPRRGIAAKPDNILITLGAQNALWMTAQLLLTQRRTAAIENPSYPGLRWIMDHARGRTLEIDVDEEGLNPDDLPDSLDAVFVTVSHHCPTNATMPLSRRKALLKKAVEQGFVIVEDDYEFEISFQKSPLPALKSLDETGAVIYVGSFSKSLFPGLRLGYIVAPSPFIREARALRALVLRHPPGHIQRTAAHFLSLGHYDAQVNRMGKAYGHRRAIMEQAIAKHGLQTASAAQTGGSSFWMRAPKHVDTHQLAKRLHTQGVVIEPGHVFFGGSNPPRHFYRLAYSSIGADRIDKGIELIAKAIAESGPIQAV